MKKILLFIFFVAITKITFSQDVPELIYYKFDTLGNQYNYASSPAGNNPAIINNLIIDSVGQFGTAIIGVGGNSSSNNLSTGWQTNLQSSGWTISFWMSNFPAIPSTTGYLFGDGNANSFRCFAGGIAGNGNIALRGGGLIDTYVNGVCNGPNVVHIVNNGNNQIDIYVNGVYINSTAQTTTAVSSSAATFLVGGYSANNALYNNSMLDEFRVYDRALTPVEIHNTWNKKLPYNAVEITEDSLLFADYSTIIFDSTLFNSSSAKNMMLKNNLNDTLFIDSAIISGQDSLDFEINGLLPPYVLPNDSIYFDIFFSANDLNESNAEITFYTSSFFDNDYRLYLTGTGIDTIAPVVDPNFADSIFAECEINITEYPNAIDNYFGLVNGFTYDSTYYNQQGSYTIEWIFQDSLGNTSYLTQYLFIEDITPPEIFCIGNQTINLTQGQNNYIVNGNEFEIDSVIENCSNSILENNYNNSSTLDSAVFLPGTTEVIWTITDAAGNIDTCSFSITVNPFISVDEINNGFDVYPNPANNFILIENKNNSNISKIEISDVYGKLLLYETDKDLYDRIDISNLNSGIYFIKIFSEDKTEFIKFVKE